MPWWYCRIITKNRAEPRRRVDNFEKFWRRREGGKQGAAQGRARWYRATPRQFRRWWEPAAQIYANEGKKSGRSGGLGIHVARNSSLPRRRTSTRSGWSTGGPRVVHGWSTGGPRVGHGWATGGPRLPAAWEAPGQKIISLGGQAWPEKCVGAAQAWPLWKGCGWATHGPRLCVAHPHPYFLTSLSIVHGRKRVHSLLACK